MILSLEDVSFRYVTETILDHVNFVVNEKEKWGVVGRNGSGKSTLMKIMAEVEQPDSGTVTVLRKYRISYCPQQMEFPSGKSVYDTVLSYLKEDSEVYQVKSILNRLGITDYNEAIDVLSGGQKKRVALAIALIREADLYLLDEPTNHLDQEMIIWLERYLMRMNKAVVLVTHDRYFLSRITNHIVDLERGKLYQYDGSYADYLEQREVRYEMAMASEAKRQNFLRREIEWIRRGAQARSTKQKGRIQRYEAAAALEAPPEKETLEMKSTASRLGGKTIDMIGISKRFDDKVLFQDFSYQLRRNDRVGIIGGNGAGKSTFLKILVGEVKPDTGVVEIGETVKIGYFSQHSFMDDDHRRVIDYLRDFGEYVMTADGEQITASQMLERFLFHKDDQYKELGKCSGGERRRLHLCSILIQAPNVLLLDEPTNDLDTDTLTILEDYLENFRGAVFAISHDRYFLDKTCDRLFVFDDETITIRDIDYSTYLEEKSAPEGKETVSPTVVQPTAKKAKMSYKEKKELNEMEGTLAKLEEEIAALETQMGNESSYEKIAEISALLEEKRSMLEAKEERWMELLEKAEG